MKALKKILAMVMLAAAIPTFAQQQVQEPERDYNRGWYMGAQGGLSVGEADFSSFGADKFRAGFNGGLFGGYRFNPVLSLEANAKWGQVSLGEQDCCYDRGYWLGTSDWERYKIIPADAAGYYYKDIMSRTFIQQYGLQLNVNLLGFFNATKDSRWKLEVSPAISAVGTCSDILLKDGKAPVRENISQWHLGVGGALQASYAVTKQMNVGLYGNFTHLSGDPMDGMPELHSTNFTIDAGVRISWRFGSKKRKAPVAEVAATAATVVPVVATEVAEEQPVAEKVKPVEVTDTVEVKPAEEVIVKEEKADKVVPSDTTVVENEIEQSPFPVIYFSFNSIWIEPSERGKVKEIADMMKADKSIRIRVVGWTDNVGSEEVNKRISLQRAEAVKRVLGQWLIPADRVETAGAGIKHDAKSDSEARNATTIEITENR